MAKLSEKIGYALGDAAAGGITWKVMSIAFPLFFTNIFGLTVADTATLMLVARLFDVVTDPMMGALADRTQSKWGTYRPWLIFGAIPLGLVFALLLYTPDLGPVGKRIYAYSMYLLMMAVYTAVNVPYGSLLGVMTADDNEKNEFSSYRMVGAYATGWSAPTPWASSPCFLSRICRRWWVAPRHISMPYWVWSSAPWPRWAHWPAAC